MGMQVGTDRALQSISASVLCAGMDCPRVRYPQLNDVVEADLAEQGLQVLTGPGQQVDKVIQLYEVGPLVPLLPPASGQWHLCCPASPCCMGPHDTCCLFRQGFW